MVSLVLLRLKLKYCDYVLQCHVPQCSVNSSSVCADPCSTIYCVRTLPANCFVLSFKLVVTVSVLFVSPLCRLAGKEHLFEVVTPSRTFYVQAETDAELQDWLKAFETLLKTSRSSQQVLFVMLNIARLL